jgi:prepilin-type N-terminal cleavage/methylation domain-containing protein
MAKSKSLMARNSGFTLVELVIVMTIIAIISTVSLASLANYSQSQTVKQATYDVQTLFRQAKSYAQSQVKPASCGTSVLNGYRVDICGLAGSTCATTDTYQLSVICGALPTVQATRKLPAHVSFQQSGTTSVSYTFPLLTSGVTGAGSVVLAGYNRTNTITVSPQGAVSVQ